MRDILKEDEYFSVRLKGTQIGSVFLTLDKQGWSVYKRGKLAPYTRTVISVKTKEEAVTWLVNSYPIYVEE
jgi:hypothetical protein